MDDKKIFRHSYQKKFDSLKNVAIEKPLQGWLKTIREFLGMTSTQFAKKIQVSQSRVINMEQNEKNLKISTMERIADSLDCDFIYAFVPRENIETIFYNQARKKALKILKKVNHNMGLENQLAPNNKILDDLIKELLDGNIARIWDENEYF